MVGLAIRIHLHRHSQLVCLGGNLEYLTADIKCRVNELQAQSRTKGFLFQLEHPKGHFSYLFAIHLSFAIQTCYWSFKNTSRLLLPFIALDSKYMYNPMAVKDLLSLVFVIQMMESVLTVLPRWWASPTTATMLSTSSMNWFKQLRYVLLFCALRLFSVDHLWGR